MQSARPSDLFLTVEIGLGAGTATDALLQMAELAMRLQINVRATINEIDCTVYYPLLRGLLQIDTSRCCLVTRFDEAWATVLRTLGDVVDTPPAPEEL